MQKKQISSQTVRDIGRESVFLEDSEGRISSYSVGDTIQVLTESPHRRRNLTTRTGKLNHKLRMYLMAVQSGKWVNGSTMSLGKAMLGVTEVTRQLGLEGISEKNYVRMIELNFMHSMPGLGTWNDTNKETVI